MDSPPKRRLQFSLGTLVFGVIAAGAVIGMIFAYYENRKLSAEIHALKEQFGFLTIDDPTKIWARSVETDENYKWKFRVYVPRDGSYRIGVQTENVVPAEIDRNYANYHTLGKVKRGEFVIDAQIVRLTDERGILQLRVPKNDVTDVRLNSYGAFNVKSPATWFYKTYESKGPQAHSCRWVDEDKPMELLSVKMEKTIGDTEDFNQAVRDPGPGVLIWLEKEPPHEFRE
ncbi:MAG TPA: LapA family protein [Planctomycetota bacterium]|nr:LapA family protein [Planctomycetota bacterium]